ncbi:hypothetical protein WJX75_008845 [Coccomyxa subellipsoidea]|uniref:Uncharacterized protein n=1 Tax=Coccomyxa subellipsoidea TaxID=248742 RepID=A0ABR2YIA8_9CHLO
MTGTVFSASLSLVLCALFALSGEAAITVGGNTSQATATAKSEATSFGGSATAVASAQATSTAGRKMLLAARTE